MDPEAGLPFWAWEEGPVEVRLVQRLPDQTRAFFIGRGLLQRGGGPDRAQLCLSGHSAKPRPGRWRWGSPSTGDLAIDLATWRLEAGAGPQALPPKEGWDPRWEAMGESTVARIALRWSLFPTTQTFRPGRLQLGHDRFGVPPGTRFDLTLAWTLGGEPQSAVLRGLVCAPEDIQHPL